MSSSASNRNLDGASSEGQVQPRSEGYGALFVNILKARFSIVNMSSANIEARDLEGTIERIIGTVPIIGGIIAHMVDAKGPPNAQDLVSLQNAADEVTRVLSAAGGATNSTVSPIVGNISGEVGSNAPAPVAGALSDDPNGSASASAATPSQTAAVADAPSSSAQPTAPPPSPAPPSGPPNTPALPVNV